MTTPTLDFWFEFASTYSYPAAMRIVPLARTAGVKVNFRPFLLGPIFKAQGWSTSPFNLFAAKGRNMWRDVERICDHLALPFRRPEPFPQSSLLAARVALVGLGDAWGEDYCRAVYRAEFADGRRIDEPETIREILSEPEGRSGSRDGDGERGRNQRKAAIPNGGSAADRYFWRSQFHNIGRRAVLGKRPARKRDCLGDPR